MNKACRRFFSEKYRVYEPKNAPEFRKMIYKTPITIPTPNYLGKINLEKIENMDLPIDIKYKPYDLETIKSAGKLANKIMNYMHNKIAIGMTTNNIDYQLFQKIIQNFAYPSLLDYRCYCRSSFTSINNVTHGIPGEETLYDGDIFTLDFAIYYQGFHIDISDTFLIGDCDNNVKALSETAQNCTYAIIEHCKPGQNFNAINKIVRSVLRGTPFSVIPQFSGHGIGRQLYQAPEIYFDGTHMEGIMEPGMVFTIEPLIVEGSPKLKRWPNMVTFSTKDTSRLAKFERTILITDTGAQTLTD